MTPAPQRETPARWQAAGADTSGDLRTRELTAPILPVSITERNPLEETDADHHHH